MRFSDGPKYNNNNNETFGLSRSGFDRVRPRLPITTRCGRSQNVSERPTRAVLSKRDIQRRPDGSNRPGRVPPNPTGIPLEPDWNPAGTRLESGWNPARSLCHTDSSQVLISRFCVNGFYATASIDWKIRRKRRRATTEVAKMIPTVGSNKPLRRRRLRTQHVLMRIISIARWTIWQERYRWTRMFFETIAEKKGALEKFNNELLLISSRFCNIVLGPFRRKDRSCTFFTGRSLVVYRSVKNKRIDRNTCVNISV